MNCFSDNGCGSFRHSSHQSACSPQRPCPGPPGPPGIPGPPGPRGPQGNTGPANGLNEYASVYNIGSQNIAVILPGNVVPVLFSNNALLSEGITHAPGTPDIVVTQAGDYEITYALYFTSTVAALSTFAIQANTANLSGGVFSKMLSTGYQVYSGGTITTLSRGDIVRVIFTASIALNITLTGSDVTAFLNIKKLN